MGKKEISLEEELLNKLTKEEKKNRLETLDLTKEEAEQIERIRDVENSILGSLNKQSESRKTANDYLKSAYNKLGEIKGVIASTAALTSSLVNGISNFETILYGLEISPNSLLDPREWLSIAAELKDTNTELYKLGVRAGKGAEEGQKLSDTFVSLQKDLGETSKNAREIVSTLSENNYIGNIKEAAETVSLFSRATGAARSSTAEMMEEYSKVAGFGEKETTNILANITKIQQTNGISKKGVDALVSSTKVLVANMKAFGYSDESIKRMTISTAKLVSQLEKVGVSAATSTKFIEDLLDPERIEDNIKKYAALGVSISDALSGEIDAGQIGEGLKEFGQKLKEIGPIAGTQYAKAFGISYKDAIKAANMEDAAIGEVPVDESVKAMQEMKDATLDATAAMREQMNILKGTLQEMGDNTLAMTSAITKATMALFAGFGMQAIGVMNSILKVFGVDVSKIVKDTFKSSKEIRKEVEEDLRALGIEGELGTKKRSDSVLKAIKLQEEEFEAAKRMFENSNITLDQFNAKVKDVGKKLGELKADLKESERRRDIVIELKTDNARRKLVELKRAGKAGRKEIYDSNKVELEKMADNFQEVAKKLSEGSKKDKILLKKATRTLLENSESFRGKVADDVGIAVKDLENCLEYDISLNKDANNRATNNLEYIIDRFVKEEKAAIKKFNSQIDNQIEKSTKNNTIGIDQTDANKLARSTREIISEGITKQRRVNSENISQLQANNASNITAQNIVNSKNATNMKHVNNKAINNAERMLEKEANNMASKVGNAINSKSSGGLVSSINGMSVKLGKVMTGLGLVAAALGVAKTAISNLAKLDFFKGTFVDKIANFFGLKEEEKESLDDNTAAVEKNTDSQEEGPERLMMTAEGRVVTTGSLAMKEKQKSESNSTNTTSQPTKAEEKKETVVQNDPKVANNTSIMIEVMREVLKELQIMSKGMTSTVNQLTGFSEAEAANTNASTPSTSRN